MEEYLLDVLLYFNGWFVFIVKFLYTRKVVVSSDPVMRVLIRKKKIKYTQTHMMLRQFCLINFQILFPFSVFHFLFLLHQQKHRVSAFILSRVY